MIADQIFGEFPPQMSLFSPPQARWDQDQTSTVIRTPPDIGHRGTLYPLERSVTLHSTLKSTPSITLKNVANNALRI